MFKKKKVSAVSLKAFMVFTALMMAIPFEALAIPPFFRSQRRRLRRLIPPIIPSPRKILPIPLPDPRTLADPRGMDLFLALLTDPKAAIAKWSIDELWQVIGSNLPVFREGINGIWKAGTPATTEEKAVLKMLGRLLGFRYNDSDVENLRWVPKSMNKMTTALWGGTRNPNVECTTYGKLVICPDDFASWDRIRRLSILAHELIHVAQYRQMGWENFLRAYLEEALRFDTVNGPLEKEGYDAGTRAFKHLSAEAMRKQAAAAAAPPSAATAPATTRAEVPNKSRKELRAERRAERRAARRR